MLRRLLQDKPDTDRASFLMFDEMKAMTKDLLEELVVLVEAVGGNVVAAVSDLGGSNRGLWSELDVDHEGSAHFPDPVDKLWKIWMLADTPYLLKLLRNHVLDGGVKLPNGGVVDKKLLMDVLAIDAGHEYRILSKLSVSTDIEGKIMAGGENLGTQNNESYFGKFGKLKCCMRRAQTSISWLFSLGKFLRLLSAVTLFCVITVLSTSRAIPGPDLGRLTSLADSFWNEERATPGRGPRLILIWNTSGGSPAVSSFRDCPVTNCQSTTNRSLLAVADAVIFHGLSLKPDELPATRRPSQHFVFFLLEPPTHVQDAVRHLLDDFFTMSISYHREADVPYEYGRAAPGGRAVSSTPFENRTRAVAWAVSNCHPASGRNEYAKELSKHIDIDIYGKCNELKTPPSEGRPPLQCPARKRGAPTCYPTLARDYMFYLAFENSRCREYITEKFWLPLRTGMVPIALGPSREQYHRLAPPDSFLHVADFVSPAHLARRLKELMSSRDKFERLLAWRDRYHISQRRALCDLCALLQTPQQPAPVNISHRWSVEQQCEPALS